VPTSIWNHRAAGRWFFIKPGAAAQRAKGKKSFRAAGNALSKIVRKTIQ
jgi:hypothetical protein